MVFSLFVLGLAQYRSAAQRSEVHVCMVRCSFNKRAWPYTEAQPLITCSVVGGGAIGTSREVHVR